MALTRPLGRVSLVVAMSVSVYFIHSPWNNFLRSSSVNQSPALSPPQNLHLNKNTNICTRQESQCLPYAGFFTKVTTQRKSWPHFFSKNRPLGPEALRPILSESHDICPSVCLSVCPLFIVGFSSFKYFFNSFHI